MSCLVAVCCLAACCLVDASSCSFRCLLHLVLPFTSVCSVGKVGIMWYKETRAWGEEVLSVFSARCFVLGDSTLWFGRHPGVSAFMCGCLVFACLVLHCLPRSVIYGLSICLYPCWSRATLASCLLGRGNLLAATYLAVSEHTFVFFADDLCSHAPCPSPTTCTLLGVLGHAQDTLSCLLVFSVLAEVWMCGFCCCPCQTVAPKFMGGI